MKSNRFLIVVDVQNDFVDGALGSKEAQSIIPNVCKKIKMFDGMVIATMDTHYSDYLNTAEGEKLPVKHCIIDTPGRDINDDVINTLVCKKNCFQILSKESFGSPSLPEEIISSCNEMRISIEERKGKPLYIEVIGLCTDICVISNVAILKAFFPEAKIVVDAACCAGTTIDMHNKALDIMESIQVDVINR